MSNILDGDLFTIRYCVEYDLLNSTLATGVMCVKSLSPAAVAAAAAAAANGGNGNSNNNINNNHNATVCSHRIELSAKPTAVMWHPKLNGDFEDRYKMLLSCVANFSI